jgi:hypothetical protein
MVKISSVLNMSVQLAVNGFLFLGLCIFLTINVYLSFFKLEFGPLNALSFARPIGKKTIQLYEFT